MSRVITFNGKGYEIEKLPEEVQAIVNTIEEVDKKLRELNIESIIAGLAKENLYTKLAGKYDESWEAAEIELQQSEQEK